MAEGEEYRIPTATTSEEDLSIIRVVIIIPGLNVTKKILGFGDHKLKNAEVDHKFDTKSFWVTVSVKKKDKKEEKYRYAVKKLPGEIDPGKCTIEYKSEQVILLLHKAEETSWAVQLSSRGLEQAEED